LDRGSVCHFDQVSMTTQSKFCCSRSAALATGAAA
jgi:hypothetical protein